MRTYLIVETRDAAGERDAARTLDLASGLSRTGASATILLTENGAFNARVPSHYPVEAAIEQGVNVSVDCFALDERGIGEHELKDGISVASMDMAVDHLINGSHVIWR